MSVKRADEYVEHVGDYHDFDLLTQDERSALRRGLAEIQTLGSRLFSDIPTMTRGGASSDIGHLIQTCIKMRNKLLEFPDKPKGSTP